MSKSDFSSYLQYLKDSESIYDPFVVLLRNSLNAANDSYITNVYDSSQSAVIIQNLSDSVTKYKKNIESVAGASELAYGKISAGGKQSDLPQEMLAKIAKYYGNYKAGIYTRSSDLEEQIHAALYSPEDHDNEYDAKNGVYKTADSISSSLNSYSPNKKPIDDESKPAVSAKNETPPRLSPKK